MPLKNWEVSTINIFKPRSVITLYVNGITHELIVSPNETLLNVLREKLAHTGARPGCEEGNCGTCTILIDGSPMKSCLMLAIEAVGHKITTIEGLNDTYIQKAFVKHQGFQCGYCTPGFIINITGLLNKYKHPTEDQIKQWMTSNICRCTSYDEIRNAIEDTIQHGME